MRDGSRETTTLKITHRTLSAGVRFQSFSERLIRHLKDFIQHFSLTGLGVRCLGGYLKASQRGQAFDRADEVHIVIFHDKAN